jgi:hypothetical protein
MRLSDRRRAIGAGGARLRVAEGLPSGKEVRHLGAGRR